MPACQTCSVTMITSERTTGHGRNALPATTGNWHIVCEYAEHLEALAPSVAVKACATAAKNNLINRQVAQAAVPTTASGGAAAAGAGLSVGNYQYKYTSVSADGETLPSPASATITTTGPNSQINVTGIAVG